MHYSYMSAYSDCRGGISVYILFAVFTKRIQNYVYATHLINHTEVELLFPPGATMARKGAHRPQYIAPHYGLAMRFITNNIYLYVYYMSRILWKCCKSAFLYYSFWLGNKYIFWHPTVSLVLYKGKEVCTLWTNNDRKTYIFYKTFYVYLNHTPGALNTQHGFNPTKYPQVSPQFFYQKKELYPLIAVNENKIQVRSV